MRGKREMCRGPWCAAVRCCVAVPAAHGDAPRLCCSSWPLGHACAAAPVTFSQRIRPRRGGASGRPGYDFLFSSPHNYNTIIRQQRAGNAARKRKERTRGRAGPAAPAAATELQRLPLLLKGMRLRRKAARVRQSVVVRGAEGKAEVGEERIETQGVSATVREDRDQPLRAPRRSPGAAGDSVVAAGS